MKAKQLSTEMRVEAGRGNDHDIGTVDGWNQLTGLATVRWDSGVVTRCPISHLTQRPGDEQPTITSQADAVRPLRTELPDETVSFPAAQAAEIAKLRHERDALRQALQLFLSQYEGNGHDERERRPEIKVARAALALSSPQPHAVKIEVTGGCAEVTECPESVHVTIIDHDNEEDAGPGGTRIANKLRELEEERLDAKFGEPQA